MQVIFTQVWKQSAVFLFTLCASTSVVYFYTMMTQSDLYALLDAQRELLGLSQAEVGRRALGQNSASALQNIKRGSSPTFDNLNAICDVLGLDVQIGPRRGSGGMMAESEAETDFSKPTPSRMGYLPIPWLRPALNTGSAPISIQRDYLAAHGLIPDRLSAIIPHDVGLDVPFKGPFVAVLDARFTRRGHGLWAFVEGGRDVLAHLTFDGANIIIAPATPNDPARLIDVAAIPGITVLGRVVWLAALP
jgi:transcriptional regulator with XRE-family HTH domain